MVDLRDDDVVRDGLGEEQALAQSILRHETDAGGDGVAGICDLDRLSVLDDLSAGGLAQAEQRQRQFRASGVQKAGDAQDLAAAQVEGDVLKAAVQREILDLQHVLLALVAGLEGLRLKFAARHIVGELLVVQVGGVAGGNHLTAAHDGEALRNFKYLVELVADEQDGDALGLELQDDLKEGLDLLLRQRRGGLVHDDELGVEHQRAADGDHLLLRDGEGTDQAIQLHVKVDLGEGLLGDLAHALLVHQLVARGQLGVERQVLHDRQVREDGEILIDDLNAHVDGFQRRDFGIGLSIKLDVAAIGLVHAADDLDDGRFSAAVFAGKAVHLAGLDFQRHVLQRLDSAERFADVYCSEQILGHCLNPPYGGLTRRVSWG